jgi:PAS domain S-box-containing protein
MTASPVVLYTRRLADPARPLTWISDNLARLLGHELSAALAPDWWPGHLHPEDRDQALTWLARLGAGGSPRLTYRFRDGAGRMRWIEDEIGLPDGEAGAGSQATGVWRDVTEAKQADSRLRQAAALYESTREGVLITDLEGRIISANQAFTDITGYNEAEVLHLNPRLLSSGRQDPAFYQALWASITTSGYWRGELWNRRKNGEIYPLILSISTVRDSRDRPQPLRGRHDRHQPAQGVRGAAGGSGPLRPPDPAAQPPSGPVTPATRPGARRAPGAGSGGALHRSGPLQAYQRQPGAPGRRRPPDGPGPAAGGTGPDGGHPGAPGRGRIPTADGAPGQTRGRGRGRPGPAGPAGAALSPPRRARHLRGSQHRHQPLPRRWPLGDGPGQACRGGPLSGQGRGRRHLPLPRRLPDPDRPGTPGPGGSPAPRPRQGGIRPLLPAPVRDPGRRAHRLRGPAALAIPGGRPHPAQ